MQIIYKGGFYGLLYLYIRYIDFDILMLYRYYYFCILFFTASPSTLRRRRRPYNQYFCDKKSIP